VSRGVGSRYEELAAAWLAAKGYRVLERSFSCPMGEVDIIAEQGGDLAFVEVKARRSEAYGRPCEAVTRSKQAKIIKAALVYIKSKGLKPAGIRFDVVSIKMGSEPELIKGAFDAPGYYY
jgi:putative endonuclease